MKAMTTRITTPTMKVVRVVPKPSKKAKPLTKDEAIKRIGVMKGIQAYEKGMLVNRIKRGTMSPRRVVKVAREVSRLNAPAYRIRI
jgi:hypothetical protein